VTAQDNAALVREFHAAWNRRDFDRLAAAGAADAAWQVVPTGQNLRGPDGLRQYGQGWATAFPDGRIEDTNVVASETGAVVEFIGRGTQTGPLSTPTGDIPPTGRAVEMRFCEIYDLRDGKVTGGRMYFDSATLLQQLGVAAGATAGAR
jgi:steroid delta-isomerase-like uncharacterized protein